jgi:hypothetical protein
MRFSDLFAETNGLFFSSEHKTVIKSGGVFLEEQDDS